MEAGSSQVQVPTIPPAPQTSRRQLILRDSLTFLALTAFTVLLTGVTGILFRSFQSHRDDLATSWAARGRGALQAGRSADAVTALRTSLTYRPDDTANQLALAQALAVGGHTAEAENYFLNLWQARPGDGPINLELARLERSRGNTSDAVNYYRAAVFGTWAGDAPQRRRDTRLELARYLIEREQRQAAQVELLIAAGNNPDSKSQLAIGELLEAARDSAGALSAYRNVQKGSEEAPVAQAKTGELCYRVGDYTCAAESLTNALKYKGWTAEQKVRMGTLVDHAEHLQQLSFAEDLPVSLRTTHLSEDARLVQKRLQACVGMQNKSEIPAALQAVQAQWKKLTTRGNQSGLRHDEDVQDEYVNLIWHTESVVTDTCGAPAGDDALLGYLQTHPMTNTGAR